MNKKLHLLWSVLLISGLFKLQAQELRGTCGTPAPSQQWEGWFSEQVAKYVESHKNNQARQVNYTLPVIVHVIHNGEALGTFPNVDSNQVKSQIIILNEDFGANGLNVGNTPDSFTNTIANTGIRFCRALTDKVGIPLPEIGIDRVNTVSNAWQDLSTPTLNLQNYMNTVVIPATIWDPTKFFNIWISDKPASLAMNGFATYPAGTVLNGLIGGSIGTTNNDGIWVWTKAFGNVGSVTPPYDKGRTATHETGHWLGLRHIWGDGNCLSDYCGDTPPSPGPHYGCVTSTPIDQCGVNQAPNGEMPFNFMDMSNDICRYMFTKDQNLRMQAAMSQCVNRNLLGTHSVCTATPVPPSAAPAVAGFNLPPSVCIGGAFTPFNTSSGHPYPTYLWTSSPAASFSPAATVANPAITINNPGTYTITLVATNSVSSSSHSMVVSAIFSCQPQSACIDTIRMIKSADSLKTMRAPANNLIAGCQGGGFKGRLVGTNCYNDREIAQYYPTTSYSTTPNPQVNSVIVLFDSTGTRLGTPAAQVKCKIYGGTIGGGPGLAFAVKSDSLAKIIASPKTPTVSYIGKTNSTVNYTIIPYKFNFSSPVIINSSSGFFAGLELPLPNQGDSINVFSNTIYNTSVDSSSWFFTPNLSWKTFRYSRGHKIQLAIIPQITCSPIQSLKDYQSSLQANVLVVPNPNNGIFSLIFTLPERSEIDLSVYNSLGQKISGEKLQDISSRIIDLDLSDHSNGIYFVQISNGVEKTVKKVVINH